MSDDASAYRCVICDRDLTHPQHVCRRCRDIIGKALDAIVELHAQLDPARPISRPIDRRITGSTEPPVPINIDAIDLALRARTTRPANTPQHLADQTGYLPTAERLDQHVAEWRRLRNHSERPPAPTVPVLAGWLANRLDWAFERHPAVVEFAADMTDLEKTLRRITGHPAESEDERAKPVPVGRCRGRGKPCGAILRATPWQDSVECPNRECGARWPREQWTQLAAAIREAA